MPLLLLFIVAATGLLLTVSARALHGNGYAFLATTHAATVIALLLYLPFGKLFHVVQRPASVGVELYQRRERESAQATCPRCGTEFVGQMWLDDLKDVVTQLGFDYRTADGHTLQDFCPRCKRVMRGLAYAGLKDTSEPVFHGARAEDEQHF